MAETSKRKLRFAQAGLNHSHARMYRETLTLLTDDVEVVGFYDPNPEGVRASIKPEHQDVPFYGSIAELIEKTRPDAILASTYYNELPSWLRQIAEAGVHVWAEKHASDDWRKLLPVKEAIDRHKLAFSCGLSWRFHPIVRQLREALQGGTFGKPYSMEASHMTSSVRRRGPTMWGFQRALTGGGIVNWHGCHFLDLMRFIAGKDVAKVIAIEANVSGEAIDVEDAATLSFQFANGMIGSLHAGFFTPDMEPSNVCNFLGIRGSEGWARWALGGPTVELKSNLPAWSTAPLRRFEVPTIEVPGYGSEGLALMKAFVGAIRGEGSSDYSIDDMIALLKVIEACHESSRTGEVVYLA